jgi:hypothetical protein
MDKKLVILILVFFLVFGAFSFSLIANANPNLLRADVQQELSLTNSFIISSPKDLPVGTSCSVNIVSRDTENKSVEGVEACATSTLGTPTPLCDITDESGIADFSLTSNEVGLATIIGTLDGQSLGTPVTCNFTQ